jgi:hypothetical protein
LAHFGHAPLNSCTLIRMAHLFPFTVFVRQAPLPPVAFGAHFGKLSERQRRHG